MNLTPRMIAARITDEMAKDRLMRVDALIDAGSTLWAEGWFCKHVWNVDLDWYRSAGLGHVSLRWAKIACPFCGEVWWPRYRTA